jgi:NAD(P)-dependent dehydrogenase (short-subunit alcohol dehydrogenase family)
MQIAGNVALVTGAASGLGEATARHLHGLGATVVLFDRDSERTPKIAAELGDAPHVVGDATREADVQDAADAAASAGPLRIVVACAGGATASQRTIRRDGTPHDLDLFVATMNLNVVSTFNTVRLAAAAMAELDPADGGPDSGPDGVSNNDGERGVIVTTSSIAGYEGQVGQIAYATAKAGIIGMTLVAARDLASVGVRVNSIAPGTIGTRAWEQAPADMRAALEAKVPFPRRFGRPSEFAGLAEHLITNCYINGHVVRLDGAIRFDPK